MTLTIAGAGQEVLAGHTERDAFSTTARAIVHADGVIAGVDRRWAQTAVTWETRQQHMGKEVSD